MTTNRLEIKLVRVIALITLYTFSYTFDFAGAQGSTLLHTFDFPGAGQLSPMLHTFASFPVLCMSVGP